MMAENDDLRRRPRLTLSLRRPLAAGAGVLLMGFVTAGVFVLHARRDSGLTPAAAVVSPYTGGVHNAGAGTVGSLQLVSARTGWLVASTPAASVVWKTGDGGATWAAQLDLPYFGPGTVRLQMLDETRGIVVAAVDGPARLYRTRDGGRTWTLTEGPVIGALAGGFFLNLEEGWVLAQGPSQPERCGMPPSPSIASQPASCAVPGAPIAYHVTGAGRTWRRLGIPDPAAVGDVTFVDAKHGWMGALLIGEGMQQPFVLTTSDAGLTWHHQALALSPALGGSQASVGSPHFFNSREGLVVLRGQRSFAYTTGDGGASWSGPVALPLSGQLASHDGRHWFQIGGGSRGAFASTGSLTGDWADQALVVPAGWSPIQLVAAGSADSWVVLFGAGPSYDLLHTTDGAAHWSEIGMPRRGGAPRAAPSTRASGPRAEANRDVVALLANNHLVAVPPGGRSPKWELALAPEPDTSASHGYLGTGYRLAWSLDRAVLYALPAADYLGASQLSVVDVAAGRITRTVGMPRGLKVGSLAVGPDGLVYLVGQRDKVIVIAIYDPAQGRITGTGSGRDLSHWQPRGPVGGDFTIYEALLSRDGHRLYYSYLGGLLPLAGVDWVELHGEQVTTCQPPEPTSACMKGLAGFRLLDDQVLVTSAFETQDGLVYRYQTDGTRLSEYHLSLGPGFVEDFALDGAGGRLYAVGSCGYTAGMSATALSTGQTTVLVPPRPGQHGPDAICGQRLELVGPGELVVGRVAALLASPTARGTLLYVDPRSGSVLRRIAVSSEPLDVAVR